MKDDLFNGDLGRARRSVSSAGSELSSENPDSVHVRTASNANSVVDSLNLFGPPVKSRSGRLNDLEATKTKLARAQRVISTRLVRDWLMQQIPRVFKEDTKSTAGKSDDASRQRESLLHSGGVYLDLNSSQGSQGVSSEMSSRGSSGDQVGAMTTPLGVRDSGVSNSPQGRRQATEPRDYGSIKNASEKSIRGEQPRSMSFAGGPGVAEPFLPPMHDSKELAGHYELYAAYFRNVSAGGERVDPLWRSDDLTFHHEVVVPEDSSISERANMNRRPFYGPERPPARQSGRPFYGPKRPSESKHDRGNASASEANNSGGTVPAQSPAAPGSNGVARPSQGLSPSYLDTTRPRNFQQKQVPLPQRSPEASTQSRKYGPERPPSGVRQLDGVKPPSISR